MNHVGTVFSPEMCIRENTVGIYVCCVYTWCGDASSSHCTGIKIKSGDRDGGSGTEVDNKGESGGLGTEDWDLGVMGATLGDNDVVFWDEGVALGDMVARLGFVDVTFKLVVMAVALGDISGALGLADVTLGVMEGNSNISGDKDGEFGTSFTVDGESGILGESKGSSGTAGGDGELRSVSNGNRCPVDRGDRDEWSAENGGTFDVF